MWRRREILGALGTGAAGLAFIASETAASASESGDDDPKHAGMKKSCCDACGACSEACNKAFHHCVEQASAGKPRHAKMAQTVADCAAFCALSAAMISRQSAMMILSCRACADACRRCARMRGIRYGYRYENLLGRLSAVRGVVSRYGQGDECRLGTRAQCR